MSVGVGRLRRCCSMIARNNNKKSDRATLRVIEYFAQSLNVIPMTLLRRACVSPY